MKTLQTTPKTTLNPFKTLDYGHQTMQSIKIKLLFFLIWTVQERGPQRGMWVPRATPATSAPTRRLTVTPPTPTTRCASAKPAGWPKGPSVVSGGVRCM